MQLAWRRMSQPAEGAPQIEVISPYYSEEHLTTPEGEQITGEDH